MYFPSEYSICLTHNTDSISILFTQMILNDSLMIKETLNILEMNNLSGTLNLNNHINLLDLRTFSLV